MRTLIRKIRTLVRTPRRAVLSKFRSRRVRNAEAYFSENDLHKLLVSRDGSEIRADIWDLAFLHRAIRKRRPLTVLEFGCGFSTVIMADAIARNGSGRIHSIDTSEHWIENTRSKIGSNLEKYADLRFSRAQLHFLGGQIVSLFERLPNIVPDLIYLDGPDPKTVEGEFHGLKFPTEDGANRSIIAADILLYETSLNPGCLLIVDGRANNVEFLRANLRRRWRISTDPSMKHTVMELI